MSLIIGPNEFTQPDFTVTWRKADGRAIKVGRIFRAYAGVPKETPCGRASGGEACEVEATNILQIQSVV
jgi:hypothetical protein